MGEGGTPKHFSSYCNLSPACFNDQFKLFIFAGSSGFVTHKTNVFQTQVMYALQIFPELCFSPVGSLFVFLFLLYFLVEVCTAFVLVVLLYFLVEVYTVFVFVVFLYFPVEVCTVLVFVVLLYLPVAVCSCIFKRRSQFVNFLENISLQAAVFPKQ